MAKKEALQEELNLTRSIILTSLAAVFGVYGYFAVNYNKLEQSTINLGLVGVCVLFFLIIACGIVWKKSKDMLKKEQ